MYKHLLDLQARYLHTANNVREKRYHIIVAHGHIGHDLLEGNLLYRIVLVLFASTVQLLT